MNVYVVCVVQGGGGGKKLQYMIKAVVNPMVDTEREFQAVVGFDWARYLAQHKYAWARFVMWLLFGIIGVLAG